MTKKSRSSKELAAEVLKVGRLFEIAYNYSRIAIDWNLVHVIGNKLTPIGIHFGMLKRKLQKGDNATALEHSDSLEEQLGKFQKFIEILPEANQLLPSHEDVSINDLVAEAPDYAKTLPSLNNCNVSLTLTDKLAIYRVDADSIRMLLLSFMQTASVVYQSPSVSFSTTIDDESGTFSIYAAAKGNKGKGSLELEEIASQKVLTRLGGIPLKDIKTIIESLNENIQVESNATGDIGFTALISPTDVNTD